MESVKLVETVESDYDEYYKIRSSPADIYWNGYTKKPDYEIFREIFIKRTSEAKFTDLGDRRIYLVQNTNGENVGFIQFIKHEKAIEIGYTITELYQRKGYATEAVRQATSLALRYSQTTIVRIRDDNIASQGVATKCGYSKTEHFIVKNYPGAGNIKLRIYEYQQNVKLLTSQQITPN